MDDLDEIWPDIWDAIETEVIKVTGLTNTGTGKNVFMTRKFPPNRFPAVFIDPGELTVGSGREIDTTESEYYFTFNIYVFDKDDDVELAMKKCMVWVGKIRTEILDDRSLGGEADNIEDPRYVPGPAGLPPGFERQCIAMILNIRRQIA